jgi:hypothetical protein
LKFSPTRCTSHDRHVSAAAARHDPGSAMFGRCRSQGPGFFALSSIGRHVHSSCTIQASFVTWRNAGIVSWTQHQSTGSSLFTTQLTAHHETERRVSHSEAGACIAVFSSSRWIHQRSCHPHDSSQGGCKRKQRSSALPKNLCVSTNRSLARRSPQWWHYRR